MDLLIYIFIFTYLLKFAYLLILNNRCLSFLCYNLYIVEYYEFLNKPKFRNRILDTLFYSSINLCLDVLFIHNS